LSSCAAGASGLFVCLKGNSVKNLNRLRKYGPRLGFAIVAGAASLSAFAVGPASPDLTSMVPDFTTVTTAVLAVAAAIVGVYVTWKGAKILIGAVKGA
jgi:hypothetical protein